ncbi:MAG: dihydrolipoyl dehydrogenase [Gammaproteobacteria bacterium]|nr:dihydrolipoyl dehydrogenase [Gammaproteobacteria bacterium]
MVSRQVDVAIIGAGTAGLNAMGQVRRAGKSFVLINGGELGTTCARVGCMPSKAFIQIADTFHDRKLFSRFGIEGGEQLVIDDEEALEHVRGIRDLLVDRVLQGSTDEMSEDMLIDGYATLKGDNRLEVNGELIEAKKIVIACGSTPVVPKAWEQFGERIITTDRFFELEHLPKSIAVVGLGVIGLELGQALARLGVEVTGFDALDAIAGLSDEAVNQVAVETLGKEFPLHLGKPAEITAKGDKLLVSAGDASVEVDAVLASLGRRPNLDLLGIEALGVELDRRGVPAYNPNTMQVGELPVFIAGDVNGDLAILHEAGEEGRIAGLNAAGDTVQGFRRKTPLGITFCDPNIATVGQRWVDLKDDSDVVVGEMPLGPVGRALIMGKNKGLIRIYARKSDGRLLGAAMMSPKAENLAHSLAWSIQQEMTVHDILQMPFYHPVLEEALQGALQKMLPQLDEQLALPADLRPL